MRFERAAGGRDERRGGVVAVGEWERERCARGRAGGDHAIREVRRSCVAGRGMLRMISKVVRHRIWSRAPLRKAMCVAAGEATERDVPAADENLHILITKSKYSHLNCGETSIFSMLKAMNDGGLKACLDGKQRRSGF